MLHARHGPFSVLQHLSLVSFSNADWIQRTAALIVRVSALMSSIFLVDISDILEAWVESPMVASAGETDCDLAWNHPSPEIGCS
jgi:hypothetical protein